MWPCGDKPQLPCAGCRKQLALGQRPSKLTFRAHYERADQMQRTCSTKSSTSQALCSKHTKRRIADPNLLGLWMPETTKAPAGEPGLSRLPSCEGGGGRFDARHTL